MDDSPALRPALTHVRLLKIAIPVVLSNVTVPLLGIVDTGVVGQLGDPVPIGAVGLGAIILSSVFWIFGFLRMGTTGLAAQAIGAGDGAEVAAILTRVLLFGAGAGALLILLHPLIFWGVLALAPASDGVEALARDYLTIRILAAPAAIAGFGIIGWLVAAERTGAVLVMQVVQNGINIGLSALFVLVFGWGVAGVAWGSVIAEVSGLALGLWLCRAGFLGTAWRDWPRVGDIARLRRMVAVNADILIRSVLLLAALMSFLFLSARFGDVPLAATQVLIQFVYLTSYAMDGVAFAAETLVGQAVGRGDRGALGRTVRLAAGWGGAFALTMVAAFVLAGPAFIDLLTTAPEVRAQARVHLPWLIAFPLLATAAFVMDGVFIGATWTRAMRNLMIVSFMGYGAAVLVLVPAFGLQGLWAALSVFLVLRGATLIWRYPTEAQRII
ncbi:MAG: MATE family efflux transporter [Rhodobacteraceae bacterium]|nr:MATE family efflux transporter [Paracoccaceae bacterium]